MATSAPRSAAAMAIARPSRFAAPVTSTIFPESVRSFMVIRRFYAPASVPVPALETLQKNCYTPTHDADSRGHCLFAQGMSSLRDRQRESRQAHKRGGFTWREID